MTSKETLYSLVYQVMAEQLSILRGKRLWFQPRFWQWETGRWEQAPEMGASKKKVSRSLDEGRGSWKLDLETAAGISTIGNCQSPWIHLKAGVGDFQERFTQCARARSTRIDLHVVGIDCQSSFLLFGLFLLYNCSSTTATLIKLRKGRICYWDFHV